MQLYRWRIALAFIVAIVALAVAGLAEARRDPPGRVVQLRGALGCIHKTGIAGCARGRAVTVPQDIAVSPDGRHAYVAAFKSNAVAVFARAADGALTQRPGHYAAVVCSAPLLDMVRYELFGLG